MKLEEFLSKAYTCYHAAEKGAQLLQKAGFTDIDALPNGKNAAGYYRTVGGSLFAMRCAGERLHMVLAHTDSPSLRIRYMPNRAPQNGVAFYPDVEKYGGGLLRSYLDRKMKIAGRAIVKKNGQFAGKTVCSDFCVVIPSVAVHLGGGTEELTLSRDLRPFAGNCVDLFAALGVADAVDADLFCVPAEEPFYAGENNEYLCAPRIDNLASVYAALRAIIDCRNTATCLAACFNNEETGSETREGAQSRLLRAFVADVFAAEKRNDSVDDALADAFALSCDGAHALHPMRKEKYADGAPVLGEGVVIKRNDRYATDALTCAVVREIFSRADLPTQVYFHHADLRCGSTIGLMASRVFGCAVCDLGVGQLAMHSAVETVARNDAENLVTGLTAFFGNEINAKGDKIIVK